MKLKNEINMVQTINVQQNDFFLLILESPAASLMFFKMYSIPEKSCIGTKYFKINFSLPVWRHKKINTGFISSKNYIFYLIPTEHIYFI